MGYEKESRSSFSNEGPEKASSLLGHCVPKPALSQRMSHDQLPADQRSLLERKSSFRNDVNGKSVSVIEDEQVDPCLANQGHERKVRPETSYSYATRSRLSPSVSKENSILANGTRSLGDGDFATPSILSTANEKLNRHIPDSARLSQIPARPAVAREDGVTPKDTLFDGDPNPDLQIQFQDPFRNHDSPVCLRVRTDLLRKGHHHQFRDKTRSLPSSPTRKKLSNAGRRGTVQSAVESQAKRKVQMPQLANSYPKSDDATHQMNRAAKLSSVSNESSVGVEEDFPLPPFSIPMYLDLEVSSNRPPSHYIRPSPDYVAYESSKVKLEKLINFVILPLKLESFIGFGTLACFDSWLYVFTILPLRFCKAVWILCLWLKKNAVHEVIDVGTSMYSALAEIWYLYGIAKGSEPRVRLNSESLNSTPQPRIAYVEHVKGDSIMYEGSHSSILRRRRFSSNKGTLRHRRTRSTPSALAADHKADLLKGLLVAISCVFLTQLDASRMYHNIRGQATIKLYVIYNVLEVSRYLECLTLFTSLMAW